MTSDDMITLSLRLSKPDVMKAPLIGSANLLPQYGCRVVVITSHLETMVEFTALQLQFHEPAGLKKSQEVFPVEPLI